MTPTTPFLLTNDDGIDAPGLATLAEILGSRPWIQVAPQTEQSGCGHRVTVGQALAVEPRSAQAYGVAGTPADCVRLALSHLCPSVAWVLSGINAGGNLGIDTYLSGTVAAAREATFHGLPAIALSQYRKGSQPLIWANTGQWAAKALAVLLQEPLPPKTFWNVNLPHWQPGEPEPQLVFCQPSSDPLPLVYAATPQGYVYGGRYGDRLQSPHTDVAVCFGGNIAITQLTL